jgi:WD40 repeat protein
VLTLENETLKAEVELYRNDTAMSNAMAHLSLDKKTHKLIEEAFIQSGNGVYPKTNDVTLANLHGNSNPSCCAMSPDGTVVATGGADACLSLCPWGDSSCSQKVPCDAPVICTEFSPIVRGLVAAGCMDGSVRLVHYTTSTMDKMQSTIIKSALQKHKKYTRALAWSPTQPVLATSSADGTVHLYKVNRSSDLESYTVTLVESLHLTGSVESMCFIADNQLICYARGTPHFSCFDLNQQCKHTKVNVNATGGAGFTDHVSFAVMDLRVFDNKYLLAATDSSRNIVMDVSSGKHVRNLYGHTNDSYSQPKAAWSTNGAYVLGNTQEDGSVCVWDIASSQIVERLEGHKQPIRDMYCSMDVLVTTSFDKMTKLWFTPAEY